MTTFFASNAVAQVNPYKDPTPGVSGYRAEVLAEVHVQEDQFTRLAEAISADKYTWSPAAEVRTISEVFLLFITRHMAEHLGESIA